MGIRLKKQYRIGTVTEFSADVVNEKGDAFTISSATCSVADHDTGTLIRDAVTCTLDNASTPQCAYYRETIASGTSATSYTAETDYDVCIKMVLSDGNTEKFEGTFRLLGSINE